MDSIGKETNLQRWKATSLTLGAELNLERVGRKEQRRAERIVA